MGPSGGVGWGNLEQIVFPLFLSKQYTLGTGCGVNTVVYNTLYKKKCAKMTPFGCHLHTIFYSVYSGCFGSDYTLCGYSQQKTEHPSAKTTIGMKFLEVKR